ncbi:hypothetical protein MTO96_008520 [Rhipicephalus appendiculatus]
METGKKEEAIQKRRRRNAIFRCPWREKAATNEKKKHSRAPRRELGSRAEDKRSFAITHALAGFAAELDPHVGGWRQK